MNKRYSIAEARHDLAAIVHELEQESRIELTRRGEPVAVLVSLAEYRRLLAGKHTFWEAYSAFREHFTPAEGEVEALLHDTRDTAPGREPEL